MQDNMPGGGGIEGVLSIPALIVSMAYSKAMSGSAEAKRWLSDSQVCARFLHKISTMKEQAAVEPLALGIFWFWALAGMM